MGWVDTAAVWEPQVTRSASLFFHSSSLGSVPDQSPVPPPSPKSFQLRVMKQFLELTGAKLEAIGPWWKRVLFLCSFLVVCSQIGDWLWGESTHLSSYFWTGGMFGPVTYVLFGPLQLFSIISTGFIGYRFLHAQKGDCVGFCFLGLLAAVNTGFYNKRPDFNPVRLALLHLGALVFLAVLLRLRYGSPAKD